MELREYLIRAWQIWKSVYPTSPLLVELRWEHNLFWSRAVIAQIFSIFLGCFFPGPWSEKAGFCCCSCSLASWVLASSAPSLDYMSKKKNLGNPHRVIHWFSGSLMVLSLFLLKFSCIFHMWCLRFLFVLSGRNKKNKSIPSSWKWKCPDMLLNVHACLL